MPRLPRGAARYAGSLPNTGGRARRIPVASNALYVVPVTVDLGNDGMAPQVTFTAGGTTQAVVGPSGGGDSWSLDQCFLSTTVGQLDAAQCQVYAGPLPLAQYAVTGSLAGGGSQFGLGGLSIQFGWFIYAVWSGGTAGAQANLRVTGVKTVLSN